MRKRFSKVCIFGWHYKTSNVNDVRILYNARIYIYIAKLPLCLIEDRLSLPEVCNIKSTLCVSFIEIDGSHWQTFYC